MDKDKILSEYFSNLGKKSWKKRIEGKTQEEIFEQQSRARKGKKLKNEKV